nr:hypothetical protein [Oscillospiraceae bacterium]
MNAKELKSEKEKKTRLINAEIEYFLKWEGYTKAQLATKLGMSLASLYAKIKDIDKFTYPEIRRLCAVLDLTDEVKLALMA